MLPHPNCYYLTPRFLAGEYPGAKTGDAARAKLGAILDAGVTSFFDLTEPGELVPYAGWLQELAAERGVEVEAHRFTIRDLDVPGSPQQMVALLDAIDGALAAGHTVYLHCWGGIGRTGTVAGCWLVRHGRGGDEALAEVAARFATVHKAYRVPRSPETEEQMAYVRDWGQYDE